MRTCLLLLFVLLLAACSDSEPSTPQPTRTPDISIPTLLSPAPNSMVGYHVPINLVWERNEPLGENQVYSVHIAKTGEPLQDIQWIGETSYDVRWFAQEGGVYDWQILVLQLTNGAYEKTLAASPIQQFVVPAIADELIQTLLLPDTANFPNDCSLISKTNDEKAYTGLAAPYHGLTADGVYMFNYAEYAVFQEAGWQSTPYHVGNIAALGFAAWCSFDDLYGLAVGLRQADWYVETAVLHGDFATWHYQFANHEFGLYDYWTSAYGNSNAIYTLIYAHAITGDKKYLEMAQKAVNSFLHTGDEHGVSSLMDDGESLIFEETIGPGVAGSRVLNAHLLAIRALEFYADYTGDETAQNLVDMGINTVRNYLPDFDVETMSLYALGPQPQRSNSRFLLFHTQHIQELIGLYERTQEPIFLDYAFKWQGYMTEPYPVDTYVNEISAENLILQAPDTLEIRANYAVDAHTTDSVILDLKESKPIASFGFDFIQTQGRNATYPTAYTIFVSDDGENWQPILSEENHFASEGSHRFENIEGRYLQFQLDTVENPNAEEFIFGVVRVDGEDYWQNPILIPQADTLYVDIRVSQSVSAIELPLTKPLEIWVEVSDDRQTWQTLVEESAPIRVKNILTLPESTWRYLKIHSVGENFPAITQLTIRN